MDIPAIQARQPPSGGGPGFQLDFVLALVMTRLTALDSTPGPAPAVSSCCSSSRVCGLDNGVWPSSSPSVSLNVWPMSSLLCFSGSSNPPGNDVDESVRGPWRDGPFSASPGERGRGSAMSSVSVVAMFKLLNPYTLPNVTQQWSRSPKVARVHTVRSWPPGQNSNNASVYIEVESMSNLNKRR
jgi:hypothetical protein